MLLSGVRITPFLLSVLLATVLSLSLFGPLAVAKTVPTDSVAPTATLTATSTIAGGSVTDVVFMGSLKDDTELSSYVLRLDGTVVQQADTLGGTSASIMYAWSVYAPAVVPSGHYTFTLAVTDTAGNTTTATALAVDVDTDPPIVDITGGDIIIKQGPINPTVSAVDAAHGVASYAWTADAANPSALSFVETDAEPIFTPTVEGPYTFCLQVTDGLGNVSASKPFTFSYAKQLELIALPAAQNPTDALKDQSPSTVALVSQYSNPIIRSGRDEATTNSDSDVLGNTVTAPSQFTAVAAGSTVAPTSRGWSVFGLLWYWWLVIAVVAIAGRLVAKRVFRARLPQDS